MPTNELLLFAGACAGIMSLLVAAFMWTGATADAPGTSYRRGLAFTAVAAVGALVPGIALLTLVQISLR